MASPVCYMYVHPHALLCALPIGVGGSAGVVKQRVRLGAVSPKLLQVYREDGLTLDQLMAFAITEDHARQEQVFTNLHHNREPWIIRRDMTASNVPADDRRAVFVGADAYVEAGGTIIRDLFSEDRGGFFEDAGLLDMLAIEKLREIAGEIEAEGWKWAEAHIDYPHAHGMRRFYPEAVPLSDDDEARLEALSTEHDELAEGYSSYDEMPEDVAAKLEAVSDEIDAISAKLFAYDAKVIAHGGAFVVLHHDGTVRIERGFVRLEDEALADPRPEPEADADRSEEHTSELQSLMRISYAVFCLKKKTRKNRSRSTIKIPNHALYRPRKIELVHHYIATQTDKATHQSRHISVYLLSLLRIYNHTI